MAFALGDAWMPSANLMPRASAADPDITDFELKNTLGETVKLSQFPPDNIVVLAFLGVECPLAKLYAVRLAKLHEEYKGREVSFVAVNPNSQDAVTEMASFALRHELPFPFVKDVGNTLADQCGAQRTPEVFVLDGERRIRYRGRVDDQYGIGYQRKEPQRHDLKAALDELLAAKPVSVARTEAVGCLIGRVRQSQAESDVTYAEHIEPLFARRCVECHRAGDIAPFALTQYHEAAGWADMIDEVVSQERMPPWHADPKHGKFSGDRRLSAEEKQLIQRWVKAGAPSGDLSKLSDMAEFPAHGWRLPREPDLVVPVSDKPFTVPAEGVVRYQFFRVDPKFTEEKWFSAAEILPGNRAVVHHILAFAIPPLSSGEIDETAGFLVGYVPGMRQAPYPQGMAKRIPAGSKLVFQVHYTPNGSQQTDLSRLGIVFADPATITHEVRTVSARKRGFEIPPHVNDYTVEADSTSSPVDLQLLSFMPHMHVRGKSFRYELVSGAGSRETLLNVPAYDFNWQTAYRLAEPLKVAAGTHMHCTASYDNSEKNLNNPNPASTVRWGMQTWDEMMIGYFDIAVARNVGRRR